MSSPFKKALLYLGLGPDEEYDDFGSYDEQSVIEPRPRTSAPANSQPSVAEPPVHVVRPEPEATPAVDEPVISALRPVPSEVPPREDKPLADGAVRPIPISSAKPQVVLPADFNDAQQIGDRFKASQPVIINLQGADVDLARRVIDFASGLCYGLGGQMERVANQVYLITPNDVEVSDEDRRRFTERGLGRR